MPQKKQQKKQKVKAVQVVDVSRDLRQALNQALDHANGKPVKVRTRTVKTED